MQTILALAVVLVTVTGFVCPGMEGAEEDAVGQRLRLPPKWG